MCNEIRTVAGQGQSPGQFIKEFPCKVLDQEEVLNSMIHRNTHPRGGIMPGHCWQVDMCPLPQWPVVSTLCLSFSYSFR